MKLNQKQLRKLISEAIQGRQIGEPEPFSLAESNGESDDDFDSPYGGSTDASAGLIGQIEQVLSTTVLNYLTDMYDPGDPSMEAAGGKPSWVAQCNEAAAELVSGILSSEDVLDLAESVVNNLIQGEYYRPGNVKGR